MQNFPGDKPDKMLAICIFLRDGDLAIRTMGDLGDRQNF